MVLNIFWNDKLKFVDRLFSRRKNFRKGMEFSKSFLNFFDFRTRDEIRRN